jgi:hypothetical protein
MSAFRFGRLGSWIVVALIGAVGVIYFFDPTRRTALTQTAGWFLTAVRFALSGEG